jgi:predicted RNase H-like HicB family nuclease
MGEGRESEGYGMKYTVIFEQGPKSVGAEVPDLPGCFSVGKDMAEAQARIAEAIEFHIRMLREAGSPIPEPTHVAALVEVAAS